MTMQEGLANVCLVTSSMTIVASKIEVSVPRKGKDRIGTQHEKVHRSACLSHCPPPSPAWPHAAAADSAPLPVAEMHACWAPTGSLAVPARSQLGPAAPARAIPFQRLNVLSFITSADD